MQKVIIKTLRPQGRDYLMATINYKASPPEHASQWAKDNAGKKITITQNFEVYEGSPKDGAEAWSLRMGEGGHQEFFIQWDEKSDKAHDRNRALAVKHLAYQAKMKPLFGEPNSNAIGDPFFTIEHEGMKNTFFADMHDKKFAIYEKFRPMHPSEKRDCAFYYNVNASGMKHSELIDKMVGFESGKLMQPKVMVDGMPIMDHFLTKYGQEHITVVKMIAEKALVYGQITKNDKGIYINQEFIGTTIENVYDYLTKNKEVQKFLASQVASLDKTVEDDMEERVEEVLREARKPEEIQMWRELGLRANVKTARVNGIELTKEKIKQVALKNKIKISNFLKEGTYEEYESLTKEIENEMAGLVTA